MCIYNICVYYIYTIYLTIYLSIILYIIIYLSIWYLYIMQGGEHTGDARLRQHKLDEDEEEEEEDVYGNQQRQRRPALREEEDENVHGNQVLTLLAVLVQKYKY